MKWVVSQKVWESDRSIQKNTNVTGIFVSETPTNGKHFWIMDPRNPEAGTFMSDPRTTYSVTFEKQRETGAFVGGTITTPSRNKLLSGLLSFVAEISVGKQR